MTSVRWLTTGLYSLMLEANPFNLGESFWEQRSSARNLALFVDCEDLGRPPGPLTFGFTLDGCAALASHLPCLFAKYRQTMPRPALLPNAKLRKDGRIKIRVQV